MMYHNVLHVFHNVLLCLTMFYDVTESRNDLRHHISDHTAADRLRDITPSKLAMVLQGSSISART